MASAALTYAQLENLWDQAGGSPSMAPLMAAIAKVESGGRPDALNPSGATGLWQLEWPLYSGFVPGATSRAAYEDPMVNAQAAVKLSRNNPSVAVNSPVYHNWLEWEPPGAYKQFLQGGVAPAALPAGLGQGAINFQPSANPDGSVSNVQTTAFSLNPLNDIGQVWNDIGGGVAGAEKAYQAAARFVAAAIAPATWIRFGEVWLGGTLLLGGIAMFVAVLVSSGPGISALGDIASLIPGEGSVAKAGLKAATGVGRTASTARRVGTGATAARAQRTTNTKRAATAARQATATARRAERQSRGDEDDELFTRSRGAARSNRAAYRRHMDTSDLRRRTA